jgi:hypothetical protein
LSTNVTTLITRAPSRRRPEPVDLEGEVELVRDPGREQQHQGVHDEGEQAEGDDEQGMEISRTIGPDDRVDQPEDHRHERAG